MSSRDRHGGVYPPLIAIRDKCKYSTPPDVTSFRVADVGDSYAILQWSSPSTAFRYTYDLAYNQVENEFNAVGKNISLPASQQLILLKGLRGASNYTSTIVTRNDCAVSHQPSTIVFQTKPTVLHPALTHMMPHEIILMVVVFLIWALILQHFCRVYQRMAFVNTFTLGGYLSATTAVEKSGDDSTDEARKSSDLGRFSSRASSQHTLNSKKSIINRFDLLENTVNNWRKETVMGGMNGKRSFDCDHGKSSTHSTAILRVPPLSRTTSNHSGPFIFLTASKSTSFSNGSGHEATVPLYRPLPDCLTPDSESGRGLQFLDVNAPRRKISEVLLGKATKDIRRNSQTVEVLPRSRQRPSSLLNAVLTRLWRKKCNETAQLETGSDLESSRTSSLSENRTLIRKDGSSGHVAPRSVDLSSADVVITISDDEQDDPPHKFSSGEPSG